MLITNSYILYPPYVITVPRQVPIILHIPIPTRDPNVSLSVGWNWNWVMRNYRVFLLRYMLKATCEDEECQVHSHVVIATSNFQPLPPPLS